MRHFGDLLGFGMAVWSSIGVGLGWQSRPPSATGRMEVVGMAIAPLSLRACDCFACSGIEPAELNTAECKSRSTARAHHPLDAHGKRLEHPKLSKARYLHEFRKHHWVHCESILRPAARANDPPGGAPANRPARHGPQRISSRPRGAPKLRRTTSGP